MNRIAMGPQRPPHNLLRDKPHVWPDVSHLQRRAGTGSVTFCGSGSRKRSLILANTSEVFPEVIVSKDVHWKHQDDALCYNVAPGSCKLPLEEQISANEKTHQENTRKHKETGGALQLDV